MPYIAFDPHVRKAIASAALGAHAMFVLAPTDRSPVVTAFEPGRTYQPE